MPKQSQFSNLKAIIHGKSISIVDSAQPGKFIPEDPFSEFSLLGKESGFIGEESPNCQMLALGYRDGTIRLWELATGRCIQSLNGHSGIIQNVTFTPNGQILASGSEDKTIRLWDLASGECIQTLIGHSNAVRLVLFSHDGQTLASCSNENTIRLWDVSSGQCIQTLIGHSELIHCIKFTPNGQMLVSSSKDTTIRFWDLASSQCLITLSGHSDVVFSLEFSPGGQLLASCSGDATIQLWTVASGECIQTLSGHKHPIRCILFSPDGKTLASGAIDGTIGVWDVTSGARIHTLSGHSDEISCFQFSSDGQMLVSGSSDATIRLWDLASGECIQTLKRHRGAVPWVRFSSDGQILTSGSKDQTLRMWNITSGQFIQTLNGHGEAVQCVQYSPDGKMLASGSVDKTINLWDVASGECIQTLKGHSDAVNNVIFSFDGQMLASGSDDESILVWDVGSGQTMSLGTINGELAKFNVFHDSQWLALLLKSGKILLYAANSEEVEFSIERDSIRDFQFKNTCELEITFDDGTLEAVFWRNPIKHAIQSDDAEELKIHYNLTEFEPEESLFELCCNENSLGCAKYLIQSKSIALSCIFQGLKIAIQKSYNEFIVVLDLHPNLNMQDKKGKSLLHHSVSANNIPFSDALIRKGVDLTITDRNGYTPQDFAKSAKMKDLFKNLQTIIECTIAKSNEFDWSKLENYTGFVEKWRRHVDGSTLLHLAIEAANFDAMTALLNNCPGLLEIQNKKGKIPIQCILENDEAGVTVTLFTFALRYANVILFDQLAVYSKWSILLLVNNQDEFVHERIDEMMVDAFIEHQLQFDPELEILELNSFAEESYFYNDKNPQGIAAKIAHLSRSVKELKFEDLKGMLKTSLNSITECETIAKNVKDAVKMQLKGESIRLDAFNSTLTKRNMHLEASVAAIKQDLKKINDVGSTLETYIADLVHLEQKYIQTVEENSLLDFAVDEFQGYYF